MAKPSTQGQSEATAPQCGPREGCRQLWRATWTRAVHGAEPGLVAGSEGHGEQRAGDGCGEGTPGPGCRGPGTALTRRYLEWAVTARTQELTAPGGSERRPRDLCRTTGRKLGRRTRPRTAGPWPLRGLELGPAGQLLVGAKQQTEPGPHPNRWMRAGLPGGRRDGDRLRRERESLEGTQGRRGLKDRTKAEQGAPRPRWNGTVEAHCTVPGQCCSQPATRG